MKAVYNTMRYITIFSLKIFNLTFFSDTFIVSNRLSVCGCVYVAVAVGQLRHVLGYVAGVTLLVARVKDGWLLHFRCLWCINV